jgi:hypothetical protein
MRTYVPNPNVTPRSGECFAIRYGANRPEGSFPTIEDALGNVDPNAYDGTVFIVIDSSDPNRRHYIVGSLRRGLDLEA